MLGLEKNPQLCTMLVLFLRAKCIQIIYLMFAGQNHIIINMLKEQKCHEEIKIWL